MNVFDMPFSKVYACLVQKAERKGRTKDSGPCTGPADPSCQISSRFFLFIRK